MNQSRIKLSIVIVNYQADKYLEKCIHSVFKESLKNNFEIIIVDNSQSNYNKKTYRNVMIIRNPQNIGFAKANNQGIQTAIGQYILLLNPDTYILKESISSCLSFMEKHPKIGVLGCKLLNEDRSLQSSCRNFPSKSNIIIENIGIYRFFARFASIKSKYLMLWTHDTVRAVDSVKGAFFLTKREVVEKVGLLDESFFMYGEEVDYCARVKKNGWQVVFFPEANIIHYGGKSTEIHSIKNLIELHRSQRYYCKKHMNVIDARICIVLYFLGVLFRMVYSYPMPWNTPKDKEKKRIRFNLFYETAKSYFGT